MLLAGRHPSADATTTNPALTYTTVYCIRAGNAAFAPGPHAITLKVAYNGFFPCSSSVAISTARITLQQPNEIALDAAASALQLCLGASSITVEFPQKRVQVPYVGELQLAAMLNDSMPCTAVVRQGAGTSAEQVAASISAGQLWPSVMSMACQSQFSSFL
jgi:hypothetical protein